MRGTLDQVLWVTPFTAHLEIYGLCMNINTRCDLVTAGRLGASLSEWSSLLIFDDTGCRFGGGCWGAVAVVAVPPRTRWLGRGPGAGGCGADGLAELAGAELVVAELAGAAVGVSTRARLSGPSKSLGPDRRRAETLHTATSSGSTGHKVQANDSRDRCRSRLRNNDTQGRRGRRVISKWPSRGLRHRIGQWHFRSLPASVLAKKLLACPLSLACALRMP
jgi:hypothetical protein